MLSRGVRGGHVPPERIFFLQILYEDMNFIYKITDSTPSRLICPPWNCKSWEHPWIELHIKVIPIHKLIFLAIMQFFLLSNLRGTVAKSRSSTACECTMRCAILPLLSIFVRDCVRSLLQNWVFNRNTDCKFKNF